MAVDPVVPAPSTPAQMKTAMEARFPAFVGIWGTPEQKAKVVADFGQDLVDLIVDVSKFPKKYMLETAEGLKAFDAKVATTSYATKTIASQRAFELQAPVEQQNTIKVKSEEIASQYGELNLTPEQINKLAITAAKNGWANTSVSLQHLAYQESSSTAKGKSDLLTTSDATVLRKTANAYGYHPADLDAKINDILTGKPGVDGIVQTSESFTKTARDQAMAHYPQLKAAFENGSTLDDVFGSYRTVAARLLDKPEDQISLFDSKFTQALGSPEKGQMNLSDWANKLKSDPAFGYQYTNKANQDAQDLALTLARAFGKVK